MAAPGAETPAAAPAATTTERRRRLLIAVDDSSEAEKALAWTLNNLYKPGDELHLVHVIPRLQLAAVYGAPPVDFLPQQDPAAYEQLIKNAEHFVSQRFLPRLLSVRPDPVVHLVKAEVDADSIGSVVCRKAKDLGAAALVMASHTKSKLQEFFLGSVTNYCCHHCSAPVLVVK